MTNVYAVLLRGINVGVKNRLAMSDLRSYLDEAGFADVGTYINSGNVLLTSEKSSAEVTHSIETLLPQKFQLDNELIKVRTLTRDDLRNVIDGAPQGFGSDSKKYYSDVIFLMDITVEEALKVFDPRDGVDRIWPGEGVIYSQRLGSERTKSRLSKIVGTPAYKSMTIRTWGTTTKLLAMLEEMKG